MQNLDLAYGQAKMSDMKTHMSVAAVQLERVHDFCQEEWPLLEIIGRQT